MFLENIIKDNIFCQTTLSVRCSNFFWSLCQWANKLGFPYQL